MNYIWKSDLGPEKLPEFEHIKWMITLSVITWSGFHCSDEIIITLMFLVWGGKVIILKLMLFLDKFLNNLTYKSIRFIKRDVFSCYINTLKLVWKAIVNAVCLSNRCIFEHNSWNLKEGILRFKKNIYFREGGLFLCFIAFS